MSAMNVFQAVNRPAPRMAAARTERVQRDEPVRETADNSKNDDKARIKKADFAQLLALLSGQSDSVRTDLVKQLPEEGASLVDALLDGSLLEGEGAQAADGVSATEAEEALRNGLLKMPRAERGDVVDLAAFAKAREARLSGLSGLGGIAGAVANATEQGNDNALDALSRVAARRGTSLEQLLAVGDARGADARAALDAILSQAGTAKGVKLANAASDKRSAKDIAQEILSEIDGRALANESENDESARINGLMHARSHAADAALAHSAALAAATAASAANPASPVKNLEAVSPELRGKSGGTLLIPATTSLYGANSANWTAANLNVLAGGTLAINVGGTGEFSAADLTTLLTNLTASSDNGLRAGATLGFDTTNAAGSIFTISQILADTSGSTGGSINIHKLGGTTTLNLSAANNYSGLTTVSAGILRISNHSALGNTNSGTIINGSINSTLGTLLDLNGVSIDSGESLTLASGNLTGDSRVTLRTVGTTSNTWAGPIIITGSKTVQFNANPGGQLILAGPITHSDYTGPVSLRGGGTGTIAGGIFLSSSSNITFNETTSVWNINTSGNTWGNTNLFRGTLILGADHALPMTTSLNFGGTDGFGTLKLNGKNQTVAGLTTNVTTTTNKIVNGNATAGLLTVDTNGTNTFHGVLGGAGTDENNFSIVKSGIGTLFLSAVHTYSGNTTVNGGTLRFNQPNQNNESSTISIASSNATLDLNFDETAGAVSDTVEKLFIGGIQQNAGVYKALDNITDSGTGIPQITGPGTLTVTSGPGGFSSWQAANGGAAATGGFAADHDNDGVSNGIEHFIAGSNSSTGPTILPSVMDQSGTLTITWTKASSYTGSFGTEFFVESSESLSGAWTNENSPGNVTISGNQVTYTFPKPLGPKKFVRLRVAAP